MKATEGDRVRFRKIGSLEQSILASPDGPGDGIKAESLLGGVEVIKFQISDVISGNKEIRARMPFHLII